MKRSTSYNQRFVRLYISQHLLYRIILLRQVVGGLEDSIMYIFFIRRSTFCLPYQPQSCVWNQIAQVADLEQGVISHRLNPRILNIPITLFYSI